MKGRNLKMTISCHMVLTCFVIFWLALLSEALKAYNNRVKAKEESKSYDLHANAGRSKVESRRNCFKTLMIKTFLHVFDTFLHYYLMRVIMDFNLATFISVICGIGIGKFILNWFKIQNRTTFPKNSNNKFVKKQLMARLDKSL